MCAYHFHVSALGITARSMWVLQFIYQASYFQCSNYIGKHFLHRHVLCIQLHAPRMRNVCLGQEIIWVTLIALLFDYCGSVPERTEIDEWQYLMQLWKCYGSEKKPGKSNIRCLDLKKRLAEERQNQEPAKDMLFLLFLVWHKSRN